MEGTVHAPWCDGFHVQVGTPECSMLVREVEGLGVMLFGNAGRVQVALVGAEGKPLRRWPDWIRARVADALIEAEELRLQVA